MGIDPLQFDYNNQLVPPSMDSPNYNMEYNQQVSSSSGRVQYVGSLFMPRAWERPWTYTG